MKAKTHVVALKVYIGVFLSLLALTALTTAAAYVDMGAMNAVVALAIAVIKMLLVALFFMHLWYSAGLVRVVIVASLFWLAILATLTLSDERTRNWSPVPAGWGPSISMPASH